MLHEKPHRPDGTAAMGADAGSGGEWTGEKRRKHLGPSLHSHVRTISSDDSPPAQGQKDQEDPFFTAADLQNFTITLDEIMGITTFRDKDSIFVDRWCRLDDETQRSVYERLALYRLKAHRLSKSRDTGLDDETLKKELPDFLGKQTEHIFQLQLDLDNYYNGLEQDEGGSVDWYFDPDFSKLKDLGNYQRLVLINHDHEEYLNWNIYCSSFTTYNTDRDYVMFCTEMSRKMQWLKKYIGDKGISDEWREMEKLGSYQAVKLATRFPNLTLDLANTAYREHVWTLHHDYLFCDEWDIIFLEVWKLVARRELKFTPALRKVKQMRLVPRHHVAMLRFMRHRRVFDLKSKFDSCVKGIPRGADEGVAKEFIREKLWKLPRKKVLHQYKKRKMEIAESIGLHMDCSEPRMRRLLGTHSDMNIKSINFQ